MLLKFGVGNYRSFGAFQSFPLVRPNTPTGALAPREGGNTTSDAPGKVAVLFGPNASGKSNLLDALRTMQKLVLHSTRYTQSGSFWHLRSTSNTYES
jgi:AAA15 family ATPase/GTPase